MGTEIKRIPVVIGGWARGKSTGRKALVEYSGRSNVVTIEDRTHLYRAVWEGIRKEHKVRERDDGIRLLINDHATICLREGEELERINLPDLWFDKLHDNVYQEQAIRGAADEIVARKGEHTVVEVATSFGDDLKKPEHQNWIQKVTNSLHGFLGNEDSDTSLLWVPEGGEIPFAQPTDLILSYLFSGGVLRQEIAVVEIGLGFDEAERRNTGRTRGVPKDVFAGFSSDRGNLTSETERTLRVAGAFVYRVRNDESLVVYQNRIKNVAEKICE